MRPLGAGLAGAHGDLIHPRVLGGGDVMSKQNVFKRCMPVIALALLLSLFTLAVQASPPPAPLLGFTPTPEITPSVTVVAPVLSDCRPELFKQVSPSMAKPGDLITFTIKVINRGQHATVNGHIQDTVPDHLEILEIEALDEHEGTQVYPVSGQTVLVDTGILGQDAELTVLVHTKARPIEVDSTEEESSTLKEICVQNVAHFSADNCPNARAEAAPCLLPTTGIRNRDVWWMIAAGLATSALVLSLVLSNKWWRKTPDRA
jgi:uncharacterized repeat protein (TIGR01451 family)